MNQQSKNAIDTLLAESLKELSVTRPIDKITIKEITDKAGVIRPTFYNHFQDKYELLEWIVRTELMQPMIPLVSGGMIREGVMLALKRISSEKGFYTQAVRLTGQNSFADILKLCIRELLLHYLDSDAIGHKTIYPWLTPERIADFYAGAMAYVVMEWLQEGMKIPENELVDPFLYLFTHSVVEVIGGKK